MGGALRIVLTDRPESDVPFALARRILRHVAPDDPDGQLRVGLCPFFHYPRRPEDASAPHIKGALRLPTAQRAIRNFRFAGRHLAAAGISEIEITAGARPTDADLAFLHTLGTMLPVTLRLTSGTLAAAVAEVTSAGQSDEWTDDEGLRAIAACDAIVAAEPQRRGALWCRTMAHYLSSGDPWTARWVAERVIATGAVVDAEIADQVSAAYLFSGAVHTARDYARIALGRPTDDAGRDVAAVNALYTLAVIELRYLPAGLRRPESVPPLLERARTLLDRLPFDEVATEFVLVHNATALHHLDAGCGEDACATVREAVSTLVTHGYGGTTAHAVLLGNLGRASVRTFGAVDNTEARSALKDAVAIDRDNPEGWLDLAHHLAEAGQFTDAIAAARSGLDLVDMFPELHDLLGFCLDATGRHLEAAGAYRDGLRTGGDPAVLGLAAARQFLRAGDAEAARQVLAALPRLDGDRAAEAAVLDVEAEQSGDAHHVAARLADVVARFPDSELARENLDAAIAWQACAATPSSGTVPEPSSGSR